MNQNYLEKLKDPRWQKKRLEIFERDCWICQGCGEASRTLNVHHFYYKKDLEPWEYPLDALITLCTDCHEGETLYRKDMEEDLLSTCRESGFMLKQLFQLIEIISEKILTKDRIAGIYIAESKKDFPNGT